MGRSPRCSKDGMNKGAWTASEDKLLTDYIRIHGEGKWSNVAKETGLKRCGKSCRLRWMNYLRPDIKRGNISEDEEQLIIRLHKLLGNRWSLIAGRLPGRTDNEIKNYWNTNLAKKPHDVQLSTPPKLGTNQFSTMSSPTTRLDHESAPDFNVRGNALQRADAFSPCDPNNHFCEDVKTKNNLGQPANNMDDLLKNVTDQLQLETDQSSEGEGSPSSTGNWMDGNSSDFIIDFNVEDICKFLDTDFTKLGDDHRQNVAAEGSDGHDRLNQLMMEAGDHHVGSSDFLPLASSFLESAHEDWPGDDLNIIHAD